MSSSGGPTANMVRMIRLYTNELCNIKASPHLEIPVYDAFLVAVLHRGHNLSELGARLLLLHASMQHQIVEYLETFKHGD